MNAIFRACFSFFTAVSLRRMAVGATFFGLVGVGVADAQQTLTPNQLQQMLGPQPGAAGGRTGLGQTGGGLGTQNAPAVIIQPSAPRDQPLPRSELERILSARAGVQLNQMFYSEMGVGSDILLPNMGGVQESYMLGAGDEIIVSLRGQEAAEIRREVDRSGRVNIPKLAPITAAGRTFGDFRREVMDAVRRGYVATDATVSIGAIRQIRVTVVGEVNSVGVRVLTGLSSPSDAILSSNGVKKTGSLRNIQIVRNGRRIPVDLYGVLRGIGTNAPPSLTDGDQIVVPPLGPTVAIAGPVRAPGIYELAPRQSTITANSLISLAGGFTVRGTYNFNTVQLQSDGRTQLARLANVNGAIADSDILLVQPTADRVDGRVTVLGANNFSGAYSLQTSRLSDILKAPGFLGDDPYSLFGIISRRDPVTLLRKLVAFTPSMVLASRTDFDLQSDDYVRLFSRAEFHQLVETVTSFDDSRRKQEEALRSPETAAVEAEDKAATEFAADRDEIATAALAVQLQALGNNAVGASTQTGARSVLAPILTNGRSTESAVAQTARENAPRSGEEERAAAAALAQASEALAQSLKVDAVVLVSFLRDHLVALSGAVNGPGNYLIGPGLDLKTLVDAAGGTIGWADKSGVEVITTSVDNATGRSRTVRQTLDLNSTEMASRIVSPRDQYLFPQAATSLIAGTVTLQGEVRHPGVYPILRGERLSELLVRAGGLTEVAYPYGSVFLRNSVKQRERQGFQREARNLESQLMAGLARTGNTSSTMSAAPAGDSFIAIRALINDLRSQPGLGRVSIVADPAVLATQPELDPLLEQGDVLYIPQRPSTITVLGEVLNASSFPVQSDSSAGDYIERAGGYSRFADRSLVFVILPDGSARQVESSWLQVSSATLPPGSSIVVPRDIVPPFDLGTFVIQSTQVLSQLAITAASISVLRNNTTSGNNNNSP